MCPSDLQRLRRARLVREVGGQAQLAPAEVVESFLRWLDLRARYDALAAGELAEAPDVEVEGADGIAAELLHARLAADGEVASGQATAEYEDYLALRRRFEPEEPPEHAAKKRTRERPRVRIAHLHCCPRRAGASARVRAFWPGRPRSTSRGTVF